MEDDNYYFSDSGFFFFVPKRLVWQKVKLVFNEENYDEDCILCDENDRFLSRKEDLNFA